ncbi:hypothetical protein D3C72_1862340 [compost metagenome]
MDLHGAVCGFLALLAAHRLGEIGGQGPGAGDKGLELWQRGGVYRQRGGQQQAE